MNTRSILSDVILPISDFLTGSSVMKSLYSLHSEVYNAQANTANLKNILDHAQDNIPYYNKLKISKKGNIIDRLNQFPILTKQLLREYSEDLLLKPPKKLLKNVSSGSSGYQSTVYWDKEQLSRVRATQLLWMSWSGYDFGDPILQTGINPKRGFLKSMKDYFTNTYYLQAFTHSKKDAEKSLLWAQKQKNPVLIGYASSFYVLANYAKELGLEVRFKTAFSWGDKLFPHYRKAITETFSCNVYESYGSAEGFMIASQKDLEYLYIMTPNVHLEIVDDNGFPVPDGEMGHVIVTNLNAYAMPLIRYKIGDLAIRLPESERPPDTEFPLPLLKKVIGRETDIVKTPSGKSLVVHAFTGIFEHFPQISQFCIIQNSLDSITIEYIYGEGFYPELLLNIKQLILSYIQEPFTIDFVPVSAIKPTPSGKPQLIVSRI